jgi:hypothetical protein
LNALYGRSLEKWAFGIHRILRYNWINLDLFYTVIFRRTSKIKSAGFAAAMGAFLFSNDTFKCGRR